MSDSYIMVCPEYRGTKVRLTPVYAPDEQYPSLLLIQDCPRHQAEVEGFTGQVGEVSVCTQTYRGQRNDPQTLVHFGVGLRKDFGAINWRAGLIAAFTRVRNYKVDTISLEYAGGPQVQLEGYFGLGKVLGNAARTTLFHEGGSIKFLHVISRYMDFHQWRQLERGVDEGHRGQTA